MAELVSAHQRSAGLCTLQFWLWLQWVLADVGRQQERYQVSGRQNRAFGVSWGRQVHWGSPAGFPAVRLYCPGGRKPAMFFFPLHTSFFLLFFNMKIYHSLTNIQIFVSCWQTWHFCAYIKLDNIQRTLAVAPFVLKIIVLHLWLCQVTLTFVLGAATGSVLKKKKKKKSNSFPQLVVSPPNHSPPPGRIKD